MKHLLIVRHAKSSWNFTDLDDFDRPLNDRGNHDAPEMAKRMLKRDIKVDLLVSSPAKRAFKTAEYFAEAYDIKNKHIVRVPSLYEAELSTFYDVVSWFEDEAKTVALFSHNPGITDFANSLTQTRIDNVPTCGIFAVNILIKNWSDFRTGEKQFWFFDYPKAG